MSRIELGRPPRWLIATAAVGAAAAGLVLVGQALILKRWSARPNSIAPDGFALPGIEHRLRSHDGGTVFAIEAGRSATGPTVILGHGIAGDHTHWAPVAHRLVADGFRVVVFDQRGHGRSTEGTDGLGIEGLAHDVAAVVTQLGGAGPIVVAGHSMGGIGVQSLTLHHREVLDQISAIAIVASMPRTIGGSLATVLGNPWVMSAYRRLLASPNQARIILRSGFGEKFSIAMLDQLAKTWTQTPDETLHGLGEALHSFDLTADLAAIGVPTLVVCGTRDAVTPMSLSLEIAAAIPEARLVKVPEAGHMIVWEEPDRLAEELAALARS